MTYRSYSTFWVDRAGLCRNTAGTTFLPGLETWILDQMTQGKSLHLSKSEFLLFSYRADKLV